MKTSIHHAQQEHRLNHAMVKAIELGDLAQVERCIAEGATLHQLAGRALHPYSTEQDSVLHRAVKLGHQDIVEYLLGFGCEVNARTRRLRTPLHYATYPGVPVDTVSMLLSAGAALEAKDDDEASAFMWACYLNNMPAVALLFEKGADAYSPDDFDRGHGYTPLEWAAYQGNVNVVKFLLDRCEFTEAQLASAQQNAMNNAQEEIFALLENS